MIKDYKHEIIIGSLMIGISFVFYHLYGILLPFILGMLLAFSVGPIISKIQKIVKNRDLATTIFLAAMTGLIILFFMLFTQYINRDFKRFNQSFVLLASNNQENLDNTAQKVKEYIGDLYDFDELEGKLKLQADSLTTSLKEMDLSKIRY